MAVCAENVTDKPWSLVIFLNVYVLRMEDQYENNRFIKAVGFRFDGGRYGISCSMRRGGGGQFRKGSC